MMTIARAMSGAACRQVKPPRMKPSGAGSLKGSQDVAVAERAGPNVVDALCRFMGLSPGGEEPKDEPPETASAMVWEAAHAFSESGRTACEFEASSQSAHSGIQRTVLSAAPLDSNQSKT